MAKDPATKAATGASWAARPSAAEPSGRDGNELGLRGSELFSGRDSLRVCGEGQALWLCALAAPLTIALVGAFLESVTFSGFVLLVVAGMVFVSVGRGRLLGSSIRIDGRQMPEIQELVHQQAARLGIAPPQIFVARRSISRHDGGRDRGALRARALEPVRRSPPARRTRLPDCP